jgi:hypothetical protein
MPSDLERRNAIVDTAVFRDSGSAVLSLIITMGPSDQVYIHHGRGGEPVISNDDMEAVSQLILILRTLRRKQKRHAASREEAEALAPRA